MFKITRKKYINPFYLAKSAKKNKAFDLKYHYNINLKRGLIASILLTIILFHIFPRFTSRNLYTNREIMNIQVIDIPLIAEKKPPPPPPPPPPVLKIKPPEKVVIKNEVPKRKSVKDEIKKIDLKLSISADKNDVLDIDSQFGEISDIQFSARNFSDYTSSSLDIENNFSKVTLNDDANLSLDIGKSTFKKRKKKSIDIDKDLFPDTKEVEKKPKKKAQSSLESVISVNKNQFLLKESESTIGTEEYKTWNRINASLDRLDKDRYGDLPKNVKRIENGLSVSFNYSNGNRHDIFWTKGGKVIIRVTSSVPSSSIKELSRAYEALFKLIYNLNI